MQMRIKTQTNCKLWSVIDLFREDNYAMTSTEAVQFKF